MSSLVMMVSRYMAHTGRLPGAGVVDGYMMRPIRVVVVLWCGLLLWRLQHLEKSVPLRHAYRRRRKWHACQESLHCMAWHRTVIVHQRTSRAEKPRREGLLLVVTFDVTNSPFSLRGDETSRSIASVGEYRRISRQLSWSLSSTDGVGFGYRAIRGMSMRCLRMSL